MWSKLAIPKIRGKSCLACLQHQGGANHHPQVHFFYTFTTTSNLDSPLQRFSLRVALATESGYESTLRTTTLVLLYKTEPRSGA